MQFRATLSYQGAVYPIVEDFVDAEVAEYVWTDGNWGCDCNRARLIRCHHGVLLDLPRLPDDPGAFACGEQIVLVDLTPILTTTS